MELKGMTLRDYFAGQALSGLTVVSESDPKPWSISEYARHAYLLADEMMQHRDEGQQPT